MKSPSVNELVKVIQRGVAGHLTYVAAAAGWGMNSELALYPPIGAILTSRGWDVRCQWPISRTGGIGAPKTLDFIAKPNKTNAWMLAIEVKLISANSNSRFLDVENDIKKLKSFKSVHSEASGYLLIVGRKSDLEKTGIKYDEKVICIRDKKMIIADLGRTAWGSAVLKIS